MHSASEQILQYFEYEHLPPHLQEISRPISIIARDMAWNLPESPEVTAGLRKLLEAKDCFVRAGLPTKNPPYGFDPGRPTVGVK